MTADTTQQRAALEQQDSPGHPLAESFAYIRELRRKHYASRPRPARPRKRAIITMVYNEAIFFPIWLRYYSRWFAPHDIYVFDNGTTDGSIDRDGFVRIPAKHETVDHVWMVNTARELQHELLGRYDVVVVTDVDELITVAPDRGTFGDYLDWFDEEWVNCLGYELLHMRDREPPLRLADPILAQRGYWYVNGGYDKPAISMVPMEWLPGFHARQDLKMNPEPDLRLVHLHRMDYDLCLARHRTRRHKPWAEGDDELRWARHNQVSDDAGFARWFYEVSGFEDWEGFKIRPEEIARVWRGAF